jgi:DNA-binding transcriptional ArsR family regulator
MDTIAVGLIDAAIMPPAGARESMSRELLALSSVLSIARVGGLMSVMNAELISREAQQLLQEIAAYEEPRLFLDDAPSLAALAKEVGADRIVMATPWTMSEAPKVSRTSGGERARTVPAPKGQSIGQIKDKTTDRREAIRSILSTKGPSYIKDISMLIRDVSEKTIQRELQAMIDAGQVAKSGERRWTTYTLA